jgi:hypothetical protein
MKQTVIFMKQFLSPRSAAVPRRRGGSPRDPAKIPETQEIQGFAQIKVNRDHISV